MNLITNDIIYILSPYIINVSDTSDITELNITITINGKIYPLVFYPMSKSFNYDLAEILKKLIVPTSSPDIKFGQDNNTLYDVTIKHKYNSSDISTPIKVILSVGKEPGTLMDLNIKADRKYLNHYNVATWSYNDIYMSQLDGIVQLVETSDITDNKYKVHIERVRNKNGNDKFVRWRNCFGGWSFWLFESFSIKANDTSKLINTRFTFSGNNPIKEHDIIQSQTKQITLQSTVHKRYLDLLSDLALSNEIYIKDGDKWLRMHTPSNDMVINYDDKTFNYSITLKI